MDGVDGMDGIEGIDGFDVPVPAPVEGAEPRVGPSTPKGSELGLVLDVPSGNDG